MGRNRGEVNIGQLMRERFAADDPNKVVNIGFTTHAGTVAAADDWDRPVQHKRVNPSLAGGHTCIQ
jgi:erythromycin esterase-like protein